MTEYTVCFVRLQHQLLLNVHLSRVDYLFACMEHELVNNLLFQLMLAKCNRDFNVTLCMHD